MSNDSTCAPTRQKGRGAKTETPAATAVPPAAGPLWHAPTIEARNALSTLLNAAWEMDGLGDAHDSSDAIRLIHVASDVVDDRFWLDESLPSNDRQNRVANYAFDVLALITGALNYPDQPLVFERRALLGHAAAICTKLAEIHMAGTLGESLVPQLLEVSNLQPRPNHIPPVNVTKSKSPVDSARTRYTAAQLESVLGLIAGRMRTLDLMLMEVSEGSGAIETSTAIDCAQIITNGVGALADEMSGGGVMGNWQHWTMGPRFAEAEKAVAA